MMRIAALAAGQQARRNGCIRNAAQQSQRHALADGQSGALHVERPARHGIHQLQCVEAVQSAGAQRIGADHQHGIGYIHVQQARAQAERLGAGRAGRGYGERRAGNGGVRAQPLGRAMQVMQARIGQIVRQVAMIETPIRLFAGLDVGG